MSWERLKYASPNSSIRSMLRSAVLRSAPVWRLQNSSHVRPRALQSFVGSAAEHLLAMMPNAWWRPIQVPTSSSAAPSTWALAAFNISFCSITRSQNGTNCPVFTSRLLCRINDLVKKPDNLSGFSLSNPILPSDIWPQPIKSAILLILNGQKYFQYV